MIIGFIFLVGFTIFVISMVTESSRQIIYLRYAKSASYHLIKLFSRGITYLCWCLVLPCLIASFKDSKSLRNCTIPNIFFTSRPLQLLGLPSLTIRSWPVFFFQETLFFQQSLHIRFCTKAKQQIILRHQLPKSQICSLMTTILLLCFTYSKAQCKLIELSNIGINFFY